ncbi:PrsW family intramembrane metalloprotease [Actinoplanes sp. NPDC048988]|uniref:PrsW family intramembrane metalloprotease n=1 Tax=Actinoplanes sp. NPDC048988 TaxID=3363901 RepID=UPI00372203EE
MTTTDAALDLRAARAAAIEASGWGTPFRLVQLRNAAFWVFVFGMAAGILLMIQYYSPTLGAYGVGLGSGIIMFALYTIPWLFLLSYHNRYTSLPPKLLLVAALWSGIAGTYAIGLQANDAIVSLYTKAFGPAWSHDWGPGLTAPFTEEFAKASALILLIGLAPRLVRSPYDGLIIGAFAGLGLQISEDVLYVVNGTAAAFGTDQVGTAFATLSSRGWAGLFQHVLFSAVFCAGLMWLIGRGDRGHRLRGLVLMLSAMLAHSIWDNMAAYGYVIAGGFGFLGLMIVTIIAELILLRTTFRLAAPQEQSWLRAILAPEAEGNVLTDAEVNAAAGGRRTRKAYRKSVHGHHERKTAEHVLAAAHDLAQELAESRGQDTERVIHARAEIARLRAT